MFDSYFSPAHQGCIALAILLSLLSAFAFVRESYGIATALLVIAAFVLRLFIITLDPFLHMWDEAIHACVARNMAAHPFVPMLYTESALGLDGGDWTRNHIWLHKQPFFLWLMALSIKTFGTTIFALRFPSAILSTAMVFFVHGIAKNMFGKKEAWAAALLCCWTYFLLELCTGSIPTDHNDAVFIALVAGTFWAWTELEERNELRWALITGCLAGAAVLTKWLPGLLIFGGWSLVVLWRSITARKKEHEWRNLFLGICVMTLVAAPWQIYTWLTFPVEMRMEMELNTMHLSESVEGHTGGTMFYVERLAEHLRPCTYWPVFAGLLLLLWRIKTAMSRIMVLFSMSFVYTFYTLVPAKMENYTAPVFFFFLIGLAVLIERIAFFRDLRWSKLVFVALTLSTAAAMFRLEAIQIRHTDQAVLHGYNNWYRTIRFHNMKSEDALAQQLGALPCTIFNVPYPSTMHMFYFHGYETLDVLPTEEQIKALEHAGKNVVVVDPPESFVKKFDDGVTVIRFGEEGFMWF